MRALLTRIAHLALFDDARTEMTDAAVLIEGTGIAPSGGRPISPGRQPTGWWTFPAMS
jgi:hypothetical protein